MVDNQAKVIESKVGQKKAKQSAKPSSNNSAKTVLMLFAAITAGFFGGYFGGQQQSTTNRTTITREIVEGEENLISQIAKDVSPSVVSVNVSSTFTQQDIFGFSAERESKSAGTGVVISEDGLIITNRHVVPASDENASITITLADNTETAVDIVGRTNESDPLDIAFLKIRDLSGLDLTVAQIGDSDEVEVGDKAVAIGNALGQFQNTVTSGIISGFGRDIEAFDGGGVDTLQNLFQTDAAINSGNSGGPLVNSASQVIGINVATATAENISFAIPINDVKPLLDIVLEKGELLRPFLGIRYIPIDEDVAAQLELSVSSGAYIPEGTEQRPAVLANSPAQKAGLREKDIILEIDGQVLDDRNTVVSILGRKQVDDTVDIKVLRGEEEITFQVTLEPVPDNL